MNIDDTVSTIEAILFACGEPVNLDRIREAAGISSDSCIKLIKVLEQRYDESGSALQVIRLDESYQIATRAKYAAAVKLALETKKNQTLSPAAMEVLTIVAYNQPVTKAFVENVRGVDSSYIVNSLVEKDLLEEAGRLDVPGRPISYKTTHNFLRCFQLESLDQLPRLPSNDEQVTFSDLDSEQTEEE